jgi:copper(I)-binding protein
MFKTPFLVAACAIALPLAAFAQSMTVTDAYARASGPSAISGAAFMMLTNTGPQPDRLVSASSPVAERVELHTHLEDANGVMRMVEVEDGFVVPAGGSHALARGGDHVMFLGLTVPFEQGAMIPVTLIFELAGSLEIEVPVDLTRMPKGLGGHSGPKMAN